MSGEQTAADKASALGWVPQENFRGDPEKWVDADTFLKRGEEVMPILKANNKRLQDEIAALRGQLTPIQSALQEAQAALATFKEYHDADSKRQYERALADLKAQKADAIRNGDVDAQVEADEALNDLRAKPPVTAATSKTTQQLDPVLIQWQAENPWYLQDPEKTAYANSMASYIAATKKLTGRALLDAVKSEVDTKFNPPDTRRGNADKVDGARGSGGGAGGGSGKGYEDLPAEARLACDRFGAQLVGENRLYKDQKAWRAKYASDYFGEQP